MRSSHPRRADVAVVIAQYLASTISEKMGTTTVAQMLGVVSGINLMAVTYLNPPQVVFVCRVVGVESISRQRTGIVHTAPIYGLEDYQMGLGVACRGVSCRRG